MIYHSYQVCQSVADKDRIGLIYDTNRQIRSRAAHWEASSVDSQSQIKADVAEVRVAIAELKDGGNGLAALSSHRECERSRDGRTIRRQNSIHLCSAKR